MVHKTVITIIIIGVLLLILGMLVVTDPFSNDILDGSEFGSDVIVDPFDDRQCFSLSAESCPDDFRETVAYFDLSLEQVLSANDFVVCREFPREEGLHCGENILSDGMMMEITCLVQTDVCPPPDFGIIP